VPHGGTCRTAARLPWEGLGNHAVEHSHRGRGFRPLRSLTKSMQKNAYVSGGPVGRRLGAISSRVVLANRTRMPVPLVFGAGLGVRVHSEDHEVVGTALHWDVYDARAATGCPAVWDHPARRKNEPRQ
jgi:hypothetical protein